MTEEFYVNGTSPKTENHVYGITKDFRCAVGGTFVNPDYVADFVNEGGWIKSGDLRNCPTEILNLLLLYRGTEDPRKRIWRDTRSNGGPYYNIEELNPRGEIWCNLFAIYTRLLSVQVIEENWTNWRKEYIMALPFYSFDFMYRYYEKMHEQLRNQKSMSSFLPTLILLMHLVKDGDVNLSDLLFLPQEKRKEIAKSLLDANSHIKKMFTDNGEKWKKNVVDAWNKLSGELSAHSFDPEMSLSELLKSEKIDKNAADKIRNLEKNMKNDMDIFVALCEYNMLDTDIAQDLIFAYEKYNKKKSINDKKNVANQIKEKLFST